MKYFWEHISASYSHMEEAGAVEGRDTESRLGEDAREGSLRRYILAGNCM